MKLSQFLFGGVALLVATTAAFAEAPAQPHPMAVPAATSGTPSTPPVVPPAPAAQATPPPAPGPVHSILDDYLNELTAALKLTDPDKKTIEALYVADSPTIQTTLNDDTLSPLEKAQKVAALRDARNQKIDDLLYQYFRQEKFLKIEAKYRVALTLLAADGGMVATAAPTPAK